MRHKFLGTGEAGYHPLRKIRTVWSGLRHDFSITCKLVLSTVVLAAAVGVGIAVWCVLLGFKNAQMWARQGS